MPTKQQILSAFTAELEGELQNFPSGELPQFLAENLQQSLAQKGYEEAGKVIDPTKVYPPLKY